MNLGPSIIPVARSSDIEAEAQRQSDMNQNTPMAQGLAAHVRHRW